MGTQGEGRRAILLLSGGNRAAMQLAPGLLRRLGGGRFAIYSAGAETVSADPLAARVLAEVGEESGGWTPPPSYPYPAATLERVITLCVTDCET